MDFPPVHTQKYVLPFQPRPVPSPLSLLNPKLCTQTQHSAVAPPHLCTMSMSTIMPSLCASSISAFSSSGVPQRLLAWGVCEGGGGEGETGAGGGGGGRGGKSAGGVFRTQQHKRLQLLPHNACLTPSFALKSPHTQSSYHLPQEPPPLPLTHPKEVCHVVAE